VRKWVSHDTYFKLRMDAPDYSETTLPNQDPVTQIQCVCMYVCVCMRVCGVGGGVGVEFGVSENHEGGAA